MTPADSPAISTPSRPRYSIISKRSGSFTSDPKAPNVAGFSPGGQVFEGYSYLSRSTSMSTSTRSRPKGLQSKVSDLTMSPPSAKHDLPSSPPLSRIPQLASSPTSSPFTAPADLSQRRASIKRMPSSISTPELRSIPPAGAYSESESDRLAQAVADLPHNPKIWLPSQVALYLTHVLGLVPRPVVEDVTAYVRSSRMGGRAFLRLSEKDLERQGLNLKWRKLMIESVRKLRRDALRGRIWGYESGSLRWPKSSQDLEREEADGEAQEEDAEEQDGITRSSKVTNKLTLKRMRDSRKVQGMIQAFQTSPVKEESASATLPLDAVYGEGYVRGQAKQILSEVEKKQLSLRRPLRPRRSTADFPWLESLMSDKPESIEDMLSSLTEQEANDLANELGLVDLQDRDAVSRAIDDAELKMERQASGPSSDDLVLLPTLSHHDSADSTSVEGDSSISECSGTESELDFAEDLDDAQQGHKPRYSVLDEDVVRAILAEADDNVASPADMLEADTQVRLTRSHTTASIVRPSRPYRASMYTDDELAALSTQQLHTRTDSSRELVQALVSSGIEGVAAVAEPEFGTARLRSPEETAADTAPRIPSFDEALVLGHAQPAKNASPQQDDEYIFNPPEILPRKPSRAGSIRGRKATFGSKRGKAVLSLLSQPDGDNSELFASLPGATMLRQKSSDEDGWGGTLGRSGSRKGLNGVFDAGARPKSMFGSVAGSTFRKRGLERVASEAEGEALHAKLDQLEHSAKLVAAADQKVEAALDQYEETEEGEGMHRKPRVEQRLSSLFNRTAQDERPAETGTDEAVAADAAVDLAAEDAADVEEDVAEEMRPALEEAAAASVELVEEDVPAAQAQVDGPVAEGSSQDTESLETEGEIVQDACGHPTAHSAEDLVVADRPVTAGVDTAQSVDREQEPDSREASFEIVEAPCQSGDGADDMVASHVQAEETGEPEASSQLLVPLTVIEPDRSGSGSIKKRSMVLVDRKRFESLARRMTHLETELGRVGTASSSKLRGMFAPTETDGMEDEMLDAMLATEPAGVSGTNKVEEMQTELEGGEGVEVGMVRRWWSPLSWASYLSSLNPYFGQPAPCWIPPEEAKGEEELSLYALLGRAESEQEKHLLSIGAIPAYMLGLGAGVGFVLVRQVLAKSIIGPP